MLKICKILYNYLEYYKGEYFYMSIKSELRREGIEVISKLNTLKVNSIAHNIAKTLVDNFPEQNINYNELFIKLSRLNMYIAKMPNRSCS